MSASAAIGRFAAAALIAACLTSAGAQAQNADNANRDASGTQDSVEARAAEDRAYREEERQISIRDVAAQIRMADAADTLANLTFAQVILGAVGAALLISTLIFSARAANAAVKAVGAQVSAERPFLYPRKIEVHGLADDADTDGNVTVRLTYDMPNMGRSPLHLRAMAFDYATKHKLPAQPAYHRISRPGYWLEPGAGVTNKEFPINLVMPAEVRDAIITNELSLWVWGFVEYRDFFKHVWTTRFLFYWEFVENAPIQFRQFYHSAYCSEDVRPLREGE